MLYSLQNVYTDDGSPTDARKVVPSYDVFMFINQNFVRVLREGIKPVSSQHLLCESSKAIGGICATLFDLVLSSYDCMQ